MPSQASGEHPHVGCVRSSILSESNANRVELGRILGAHGLRGQVRVKVFGDDAGNLVQCDEIWLASEQDDPNPQLHKARYVGTGRPGEVRLQLDTIGDRDEATALRGKIVLAQAGILQPLAAGEFYWHELIGCEVQTEAGDVVGTVREIWETGAHDVLVVRNEAGRQNLIPTAREITQNIDLENQRIVVAGLPGLIDLGELGEEDQEGGT